MTFPVGVLAGVGLIRILDTKRFEGIIFLLVGSTVAITAVYSLLRSIHTGVRFGNEERVAWLPGIAGAIGAEGR